MRIKCLIVDHDPLSIKLIRSYLNEFDDFFIVGEAKSAVEALKIIETNSIDLIFIDIFLPKISGIDLLKSLQNPPKVIIISAHKEYAIDGFDLDVIDFLLKPLAFDRFLKAVNKFRRKVLTKNNKQDIQNLNTDSILSLKDNKKVYNINLNNIIYIESMREYVKFHTTDSNLMIKCALSKLDEGLPADKFIRIHKSYIISIKKVKVFSATSIEIEGKKIPIGRNYKSVVNKKLNSIGSFI